jgi:hypothetical protein
MEHGTDVARLPQNNFRPSSQRIVTPCELSFISKDQHQPIVHLPKLPKARPKNDKGFGCCSQVQKKENQIYNRNKQTTKEPPQTTPVSNGQKHYLSNHRSQTT